MSPTANSNLIAHGSLLLTFKHVRLANMYNTMLGTFIESLPIPSVIYIFSEILVTMWGGEVVRNIRNNIFCVHKILGNDCATNLIIFGQAAWWICWIRFFELINKRRYWSYGRSWPTGEPYAENDACRLYIRYLYTARSTLVHLTMKIKARKWTD